MRLQAVTIGAWVPQKGFSGVVHSVFHRACNLRTKDGLITLLASDAADAPNGIRLDTPSGFDFQDHVVAGSAVGCRANIARVAASELAIDLSAARPWSGNLLAIAADIAKPRTAAAWYAARDELARMQLMRHVPAKVARAMAMLVRATRRYRAAEATGVLISMVGCGDGLTPAGDDVIVGYLAGLWSTAGSARRRHLFLSALAVPVETAADRTTDISRAYLVQAIRGFSSAHLVTLARQIAAGAPAARVRTTTRRALAVGVSSGPAGICGLLAGMAAWAPAHAQPKGKPI